MPYRIYTYTDPYRLYETNFWEEVRAIPHFCVSRTLVNGIKDVMEEKICSLFCPLNDIVDQLYGEWTKNISLRIKQHSLISDLFKEYLKQGKIDNMLYESLKHNQGQFLDALRLFIELGINPDNLHEDVANKEQRFFIFMLRNFVNSSHKLFSFPEINGIDELQQKLKELAQKEKDEYIKEQKDGFEEWHERKIKWFNRTIENVNNNPLNKIAIHGVHQFTPAQLRFITFLDSLGIEVIFLFNYQEKYSKIYSSFEYIYKEFDVKICHDKQITAYPFKPNSQGHALAQAIGEFIEGNISRTDPKFKGWYNSFKNIEMLEFENVTEYAGFIAQHFDKAIKIAEEDKKDPLKVLTEQIYTANKDVDDLLKVYYPNYAKNRHFLAYPIGQFFVGIYRLWNWEKGEINIDLTSLRECLSAGLIHTAPAEILLRIFYNTKIFFEDVTTYSDFKNRINEYKSLYKELKATPNNKTTIHLKKLSLYNTQMVREEDIDLLLTAVSKLNEIAVYLFLQDDVEEDYLSFGEHFDKLERYIKENCHDFVNEEEDKLISDLLERFEKVKTTLEIKGTVDDLIKGLHFYLKQKEEELEVNWIIRNFQQIDGDVLRSRKQHAAQKAMEKKVYHFACLSDKDLNKKIDDLLPWPLTDLFITKAYSPIELQFRVYYASISEHTGFLLYALFYGLCFNECEVRLSYVKRYGDEITQPYYIFSLLGILPKKDKSQNITDLKPKNQVDQLKRVDQTKPSSLERMAMYLCPYRYFLDYVLSKGVVYKDSLQYQKVYENILVDRIWQKLSGRPKGQAESIFDKILKEESTVLEKYFPFWKTSDFYDLGLRVKNYIFKSGQLMERGNIKEYKPEDDHMDVRVDFGKAYFKIDISAAEPVNPYGIFEGFTSKNGTDKIYSLHVITHKYIDAQNSAVREYLNDAVATTAIISDWCIFCADKNLCLKPYLRDAVEDED